MMGRAIVLALDDSQQREWDAIARDQVAQD
jgi:hypothetical protein